MTKDPYRVWLSEIILQQTRIDQGTPYYEKFVAAYPTIEDLAAADEHDVLKLWQGLGYYSRARNLHATAQTVSRDYGGNFPGGYDDIRKLKGIGDYTAAAIASICFDLPHAVMDGNVLRFLSRMFGILDSIDLPATKKKIQAIATENMDHLNPGDYNQAVMEFGATVCTPANPGCNSCVFNKSCFAFSNNSVGKIPKRSPRATIRNRFIHYLVLTVTHKGTDFIYLNKREGSDIWKNLYDFPSIEAVPGKKEHLLPAADFSELMQSSMPEFLEVSGQYVHLLTHQKLHARFYHFHSDKMVELPYILVLLKEIHKYPVPRLIDRYLVKMQHV